MTVSIFVQIIHALPDEKYFLISMHLLMPNFSGEPVNCLELRHNMYTTNCLKWLKSTFYRFLLSHWSIFWGSAAFSYHFKHLRPFLITQTKSFKPEILSEFCFSLYETSHSLPNVTTVFFKADLVYLSDFNFTYCIAWHLLISSAMKMKYPR